MLRERIHNLINKIAEKTQIDLHYVLKNSFWMNGNSVISLGFGLLLSIVLARTITQEQFGTYQYIISLGTIINFLCLTGINTSITQAVARGYEGSLRSSIKMQLSWGIIPLLAAFLWSIKSFVDGNTTVGIGLLIIGITSPLLNAFNTFGAFLSGKKKFQELFFSNAAISLSYYSSMFLGLYFLKNELFLASINLCVNAAITIFMYVHTVKKYKPNNETEHDTLDYGKKLSLLKTVNGVLGQVDNIFVYSFLGPASFAIYNLASNIPDKISGVIWNLYPITIPRFSSRSASELQKTVIKKVAYILTGSGFIMAAYMIGAPLFFKILFPNYVEGVFYSQIYAFSVIFGATGIITSGMLVSQKNQKETYVIELASPIVMTILQFVMVITHGLMGIIVARVIGSIFKLTLSLVLIKRVKHVN